MRPQTPAPRQPSEPVQCTRTILIIDDDPAIAKALIPRLNAVGFEVTATCDGSEGYWAAQESRPDLILLDYMMPGNMGNQVLGKLKSHARTRDIPVVILSAMTDVGVQRDVLRLGAEEWINKPYDHEEVIRCIKRLL